tara:strand:- start:41 stop:454 length:414 start_codon:yes stop_codon:yes gene_type:complete
MKSYTQFMKEVNYSAYGQATLGSTPGRATDQQIKSGVDRAIKNIGTGKGSGQIGQRGKFGLTGGVNISATASGGGSKPIKTTTPTTTKTTPTSTTTKTTPTRPNLVSSSSSSTPSRSSKTVLSPLAQRVSDIRMGRM